MSRGRKGLEGAHAPWLGGDGADRAALGPGLAGGLVARSDLAEQERGAKHGHGRRVIRVRVGEQDTGDAAAILARRAHGLEVRLVGGPGVDDVGRVGAHHVGVGALERHRPGIRRDDPDDLGVSRRGVDGREYSRHAMAGRWATFDCYGTLIDWEGGLRAAFGALWPEAERDRLLRLHHTVEPRVQEHGELTYREVLARCLAAVSAIDGLPVPEGRRDALAESLPSWPPFPEVPGALAELRERGWRLAILSNTDPDLL